ncbi:unnamed protein product [Chrysoparadoxa australica]
MEVYNSPVDDWDVQVKTDDSPLTRADLAANDILCQQLSELYPDIPIVSEENKMVDYEQRKSYERFFCIDPVDGTKEFIKRNGQFTVNVGLCDRGVPVMGVVGVPAAELPRTYFAAEGMGAFVETDADKRRTPIKCRSFSEEDEGLTIVASASHNNPATDAFISKYRNCSTTSMGSSLKLLLVAEGSADVYPRLAPTCEWDTCASHAIVRAAGGEVLQLEGGKECSPGMPLAYNKPHPLNPFFVVYGRRVDRFRPTFATRCLLVVGAVAAAASATAMIYQRSRAKT